MNRIPSTQQEKLLGELLLQQEKFNQDCAPQLRENLTLNNPDYSIITPGTGTGSSVGHGQIVGFKKQGILEQDIKSMKCVSGSTGSCIYFVSGQFDEAKHIWPDGVSDNKEFLDPPSKSLYLCKLTAKRVYSTLPWKSNEEFLSNNGVLNTKELIRLFSHDIPKSTGKYGVKLDFEAFLESKIDIVIPVRDANTGECVYFSNHSLEGTEKITDEQELWKVVEATKTIPIVAGGPVQIREKHYYDGSYADPLQLGNIDLDTNTLPIILFPCNIFNGSNQTVRLFKKYALNTLLGSGIGNLNEISEKIYSPKYLNWLIELAYAGKIALIYNPQKRFDPLDNSRETIHAGYHAGIKCMKNNLIVDILVEHAKQKRT